MATEAATSTGPKLRLWDMCHAANISPATYENWRRRGLLPAAIRQGRHSYYTRDHLDRLRQIVAARERNVTLADLRDRFDPLPDDEDDAIAS